jgi:hypothetical protein
VTSTFVDIKNNDTKQAQSNLEKLIKSGEIGIDAEEEKTHAGLSTKEPDNHNDEVVSRKYFMGEAILPNLVGLPSASPAQSRKSSKDAKGAPLSGTWLSTASIVVETGGTVRSLASIPLTRATPRAIYCASFVIEPLRE